MLKRRSYSWLWPVPALTLTLLLIQSGLPFGRAAERYGQVTFPNSGAAAAQGDFIDGLALLHDFEYPMAAAAFRRAEAIDPDFAMAYWGEAMTFTHPIWMQQNLSAARAALGKLAASPAERRAKAKTDREKAYLNAVEELYGEGSKLERDRRFEQAMAKVHAAYSDDVDATAFYGLAILGTAHAGRDASTYMRAAGILEESWLDHREHPGLVHYLIHCYDDPTHAPLGLRTARIYGRIAPDAPHALHMTSHIFLALGMWQETVDANVAAIDRINRRRQATGKDPIHWGHYPTWLAYAYLQLGKTNEARQMLALCRSEVESQSASETQSKSSDPDESGAGSLANMRLRYLLDTGDWRSEVATWTTPKNAGHAARLDFAFANALAPIALGHAAEARLGLASLETAARDAADLNGQLANPDPTDRVRPQILVSETRGLLTELEGDAAGAEKTLREAAGLEDTLPIAFGPPTIDKPTHELLGQFLFRHSRPGDAHVEFEKALARTPGRRVAKLGLAATALNGPTLPTDSAGDRPDESVSVVYAPEDDPICGLPRRH